MEEDIRKELTLVTTYTNQEGEAEKFFWSGQKLIAEADGLMNLKLMEYNDSEQVVAETDALGRTTKFGYDRWGNVEKVIDADGGTEFRLRDANGDLYKRIDKAGHEFNFALDKYGKPFEISGPEGLFYSLKYNAEGQVTEIRDGQIFDAEGNMAEEGASLYLDPEQDTRPATTFAYDRHKRLKQRQDPDGAIHRYKYDCRGNLLRLAYPDGGLSTFDYDAAGRMTRARLCDGRTMTWAYDARGNVTAQTDGEGRTTTYAYEAYDLLKSVTNPKGDAIELRYDGALRLAEVKNALEETYSFERDGAGRVVAEHDFAGRTLSYALDEAGQVSERTGADGLKTALSYDKLGQLTEVAVHDGEVDAETGERPARTTTYAYDILGRVTEAINPDAEVKLAYDPLGRVLSETINGQEVRSAYTLKGRTERALLGLEQPHVANAVYDEMGRIRTYTIGDHEPLRFQYNQRGLETARGVTNGFFQTQRYSAVGELAEQRVFAGKGASEAAQALLRGEGSQQSLLNAQGLKPDTPTPESLIAGRDYQYDGTGAPQIIADLLHGRTSYATDQNGQVTQAKKQTSSGTITETFGYHPTMDVQSSGREIVNQFDKTLESTRETWGREQGGRIAKRGERLWWVYDSAGRVTEKVIHRNGFRPERHIFEWNGQDQLIKFTKEVNKETTEAWTYQYDPFGRRVSKEQVPVAAKKHVTLSEAEGSREVRRVSYLWDRHSLAAEQKLYADGSTADVIWHYDPGQPFSPSVREEGEDVSYVIKDHLGTPKELIGEDGSLTWHGDHLLWGERIAMKAGNDNNSKGSANDNHLMPFRFQGQQYDQETGLNYNRFRYYDPATSGYLSSDPVRLRGGARSNGFVTNATFTSDSLGLSGCTYANQLSARYADEVAEAEAAGARRITPDDPDFINTLNETDTKYVVLEDGSVVVSPSHVNGTEISHAYLAQGQPVTAAGHMEVAGNAADNLIGLNINNHSGHYLPGRSAGPAAESAFAKLGITFPEFTYVN